MIRWSRFMSSSVGRKMWNGQIAQVSKVGDEVQMEFSDAESTRFHGLWLRDHCLCPKCTSKSGQKTYWEAMAGQPSHVDRVLVQEGGTRVKVHFRDGHTSEFSSHFLRENRYDAAIRAKRAQARKPILWGQPRASSYEYEELMESDETLWRLVRDLTEHGLSFVRNAPLATRTVASVAERLGPLRTTMYGDVWDVVASEKPTNIAYTDTELMLHQDILYYELSPGVQFLHCLQNDATGGQAVFADGLAIAEAFKARHPSDFALLQKLRVGYHKRGDDHHLRMRRPMFEWDDELQCIVGLNFSAPFQAPLDIEAADVPRFYHAYGLFLRMAAEPAFALEHTYRPGDVAVFHNRRVLHARRAFQGPRHLQGTYVDLDDLHSRYRVLRASYGPPIDPALLGVVPAVGSYGAY